MMTEGCNHQMSVQWPVQNEVNVTVQFPVELAPIKLGEGAFEVKPLKKWELGTLVFCTLLILCGLLGLGGPEQRSSLN